MRGTRWLILVAIIVVLGGVAATYRLQRKELHDESPPKPEAMAPDLSSAALDWSWIETSAPPESRTICRITARNARQVKDSNHVELEQVELRLPSMHADNYNLVRSAHAEYNQSEKRLYSDGAVDITLAVPNEGQSKHTLVSIHSSGVTFDSSTGKAATSRPATFQFENGDGKAIGASYDPSTRELFLNAQAELHWNPPGPHAKHMKIEAGEVIYRENLAGIWLTPWARMTRGNTVVEGGETVIALAEGRIHHVDAQQAHGTDAYPNRKLLYAADHLSVDYRDTGEVEKIAGEGHARLVSESEGSQVTATGDRVDLEFADYNGESALTLALVSGHGFLESKPGRGGAAAPGRDPAETRILRSESIQMKMRPGGRELAGLETHAPGELEFLPNHAGQRHRKFTGERMWINYGPQNRIQSFSAVNCRTVSDPTPEEAARKRPAATTQSKNVSAAFDPKTSQLTRMEQWGDFSYEAGDRKARADRGILEQVENRITLDQHARMWDGAGNTSADRIVLDEKSGNFTAQGHVNTSRLPDQQKKKSDSAMLSGDEPLQAVARAMTSASRNRLVKYDGDVVLWQGVNRIQADHVEIDREKRSIVADGHVVTQSREEKKTGDAPATPPPPSPAAPVFTTVKAPHMVYTDPDRLAHYSGGVLLDRAGLQMKSAELRSWLAEEGAENRLQKAFADGAVEIVQTGPTRTKTGTSEHAEYYTDEEKIILRGGDPAINDSLRGNTRGAELTYYSNDDRLLVQGSDGKPAISRIRRKHPQ